MAPAPLWGSAYGQASVSSVLAAIIGGAVTLLVAVVTLLWQLPKIRAESRKLNAEAGSIEWRTLRDEIARLRERVTAQDGKIAELETAADKHRDLERENRALKAEVGRLKNRVKALEDIFKVGPPTPEQQALLDKLRDME